MSRDLERRLLQVVVAVLCLSPLGFGLMGIMHPDSFGGDMPIGVDSHFRYLSGIFFGLGIMAASCVPRIEAQTDRFFWVVLLVVIGGVARLHGFVFAGAPEGTQFYAVFVELVLTPLVGLWQRRVARRFAA